MSCCVRLSGLFLAGSSMQVCVVDDWLSFAVALHVDRVRVCRVELFPDPCTGSMICMWYHTVEIMYENRSIRNV